MSDPIRSLGMVIRRRYVVALSLLALLVAVSQGIIQYTVGLQADDGRVINLAGRQRMLSQRITKCALIAANQDSDRTAALTEMETALALWERTHQGLQLGVAELGLPGKNSAEISQLFNDIQRAHLKILEAARDLDRILTKNGPQDEVDEHLAQILESEKVFLAGMDAIVFQYDAESKHKTSVIRQVELLIMAITFLVLALEALFIFRPAEKLVNQTFEGLQESNRNLLQLFDIAPAAMFLLTVPELEVLQFNRLGGELFGVAQSDQNKPVLSGLLRANLESTTDVLGRAAAGESYSDEEVLLHGASGDKVLLVSARGIQHRGAPAVVLSLTDISRQKKAEAILRRYASVDELTGLLNKRSGTLIVANSYEKASSEMGRFAVCFADVDGLKHVNDTYGHHEGDWYLIQIARAVTSNLREDDVAYRYGGDEIVLLLSGCDTGAAEKIMERIGARLEELRHENEKPYPMSISWGIVDSGSSEIGTLDELLRQADHRMYEQKREKRGRSRDSR